MPGEVRAVLEEFGSRFSRTCRTVSLPVPVPCTSAVPYSCSHLHRLVQALPPYLPFTASLGWRPSPTQRFIELDDRSKVQAVRCRKREFGIEQSALGEEYINVAGNATLITKI